MTQCPPLSIVLATTHPWPAAKECLDILIPQARKAGAEIILGDSTGKGLPGEIPGVRWIHLPGCSVFGLRAQATRRAEGEIIAWTEDHCRPASDWVQRILDAHDEHPGMAAIGGSMRNGSTSTVTDWANFLTTFGPFIAPVDLESGNRIPPAANISFKRSAFPGGEFAAGQIEFLFKRKLWAEHQFAIDNRILVTHVQSWGFAGTFAAHFHNGRSTTGLIAPQLSWRQRLFRGLFSFIMPIEIVRTVIAGIWGKPGIPMWSSLPMIAALAVCHSAGELVGVLLNGPGASPLALE